MVIKNKKLVIVATSLLALIIIGASVGLVYRNNKKINKLGGANPDTLVVKEAIPAPLETFEDFGLTVDKLKISAPIIPDVDGFNEKIYYGALKKGVAQFKGSVTPDKEGNLFIFGHSSYFKNLEGKYTEVFKTLNELKKDDTFTVYYQKKLYTYKVEKSYVTKDDDWSILDPTPKDTKDKTITLMTCWPPGTISKRWVVIGTQI